MRKIVTLALSMMLVAAPAGAARRSALIDVEPDGLTHYSNCVEQAKAGAAVWVLDRHLMYRCRSDVALSYYNYLGRRHVRDEMVNEVEGVFVYRRIIGVGRCWNKIQDAFGAPISSYGCDVYIEI